MSKQEDTEPVENVMNEEEEEEEEEEELTEEQKREIEKMQEAKLKETHGTGVKNTKHSYLIKKDRKKFDSADYAMKKNSAENKGEPVPKAIKKGEITNRFGSHLTEKK
ncbi:hypothetical protein C9374_004668 [Naegleria lovaniensis]|uniref:Uncharacterized protein n=1 Tax=Naegleria lovaniensis TaxID=51637 RepID=A0AA88KP52_NAELO|nr:uncharacterized protein C9374_004668 [Naegleria lovaniensis]KAG2383331.1 hypothetical protein C9374_004668 [Naegleria lovaniensis]